MCCCWRHQQFIEIKVSGNILLRFFKIVIVSLTILQSDLSHFFLTFTQPVCHCRHVLPVHLVVPQHLLIIDHSLPVQYWYLLGKKDKQLNSPWIKNVVNCVFPHNDTILLSYMLPNKQLQTYWPSLAGQPLPLQYSGPPVFGYTGGSVGYIGYITHSIYTTYSYYEPTYHQRDEKNKLQQIHIMMISNKANHFNDIKKVN